MAAPLLPIAVSLIAEFVPDLLRIFGKNKQADIAEKVAEIATTVTGNGDISESAAMIKANPELAIQFKQAVMQHEYKLEELALEKEKLYVGDVADARKYKDEKTFWLGVAILVTFAVSVSLVLYGGFSVVTSSVVVDPSLFAAVSATIGTLIGYVAANAQSVINYFFGSSAGSAKKTDEMADALKNFKGK